MKNFRTYQMAVELYRHTSQLTLPRHLRDQLSRASSSVVLNLAEGKGRATAADQRRFYEIAFGSLRECQAILDLCSSRELAAEQLADKVAAHLYKLIQNVRGPASRS